MDYRIYRILCSTPDGLEAERLACESAVGNFNEEVLMAEGVLFALASISLPGHTQDKRYLVESNVERCEFFIQMFGEDPPQSLFQEFVECAIRHALDPVATMTKVAVLFRGRDSASDEARAYREALSARRQCDIHHFRDETELAAVLHQVLTGWYAPLRTQRVPDATA